MSEIIKCGRETYTLKKGDTIMDNGCCIQFISRKIRKGFHQWCPNVSKKSFSEFKKNPRVERDYEHSYGIGVTIWVYN